MDRPRGVGRHELEVDALAGSGGVAAVRRALRQDLARHLAQRGLGEPQVEEAGTGDLDAVDPVDLAQPGGEQVGDLPRRTTRGLGQLQGDARGVVAVLLDARALDRHLVGDRDRQVTGLDGGGHGGPDGGAELERSHRSRLSLLPA